MDATGSSRRLFMTSLAQVVSAYPETGSLDWVVIGTNTSTVDLMNELHMIGKSLAQFLQRGDVTFLKYLKLRLTGATSEVRPRTMVPY